jgi:hypothetical protein
MMGPDPGEIEVKMQRYYKSLSEKRRMAGYGRRLKP